MGCLAYERKWSTDYAKPKNKKINQNLKTVVWLSQTPRITPHDLEENFALNPPFTVPAPLCQYGV